MTSSMESSLQTPPDVSASRSEGAKGGGPNDPGPFSSINKGLIVKGVCVVGGLFILRKLAGALTKKDHVQSVVDMLNGEKVVSAGIFVSSDTPSLFV